MKLPKINKHYLKIACVVVLAIALIWQGVFDYVVLSDQRNKSDINAQLSESLIYSAINTLLKPAPVDPATGNIYFPEVKLKIPSPAQTDPLMQLEYTYSPADQGQPQQLNVTDSQIMSYAKTRMTVGIVEGIEKNQPYQNMFAAVPNLQNCARAYSIYFSPQNTNNMDGDYSLLGSAIKLADGRSAYIYRDKTCSTPDTNSLQSVIEKIQSYSI